MCQNDTIKQKWWHNVHITSDHLIYCYIVIFVIELRLYNQVSICTCCFHQSGSKPFGCYTVYATTAASGMEMSHACYYSKKYNTYLGDVYSVNWMEDSDSVRSSDVICLSRFALTARSCSATDVISRVILTHQHICIFEKYTIFCFVISTVI